MVLTEWRDLPAAVLAPLYAVERERWRSRLGWDLSGPLEIIEDARTAGLLPGYVASDEAGRALGWTYFVLHDGLLQIGGLSTTRGSVARALLDAVLTSPEAALARRLSCFVYPGCDGVTGAFLRQRFILNHYSYLWRDTRGLDGAGVPVPERVRCWQPDDLPGLVRLLEAGYENVPGADCFAPDGRRDQWAHYAAQLVRTPAVGVFDPALSVVAAGTGGDRPLAAVIATRLGPGTMHLAQVVVDPQLRRRGAAASLVRRALASAADAGFERATLMVDSRNAAARQLYARLGFVEGERFVYGQRAPRLRQFPRVRPGAPDLSSEQPQRSAALVYE
jgi:ribosomal protein S18 acetylase RimI-like enzyme